MVAHVPRYCVRPSTPCYILNSDLRLVARGNSDDFVGAGRHQRRSLSRTGAPAFKRRFAPRRQSPNRPCGPVHSSCATRAISLCKRAQLEQSRSDSRSSHWIIASRGAIKMRRNAREVLRLEQGVPLFASLRTIGMRAAKRVDDGGWRDAPRVAFCVRRIIQD
jgi:hypothetical protein